MLWDSAYAELAFYEKLWPDWDAEDIQRICKDYGKRVRKFGGGTMTSMGKRVLTTVITLPTLFIIIFLLPPHYSYLALSLLAVLTATYGAKELKDYTKEQKRLPCIFLLWL